MSCGILAVLLENIEQGDPWPDGTEWAQLNPALKPDGDPCKALDYRLLAAIHWLLRLWGKARYAQSYAPFWFEFLENPRGF